MKAQSLDEKTTELTGQGLWAITFSGQTLVIVAYDARGERVTVTGNRTSPITIDHLHPPQAES